MREFPGVFHLRQRWDGQASCDGASAEERAAWLVANQQMDQEARWGNMELKPQQLTNLPAH